MQAGEGMERAHSSSLSWLVAIGLILLPCGGGPVALSQSVPFEPIPLEGETFAHDPSTIAEEGGRYFLFQTGPGISSKWSSDLTRWSSGPPVFRTLPEWTTKTLPGYRGYTWAPDVIRVGDRYLLYYSVSTFGQQVSAIGLATSASVDPHSSAWLWTDHGPVIQSTNGSPYNAIDPSVMLDEDGSLWMVFGSFWQGIYQMPLDPHTGQRQDPKATPRRLAWAESIEAPCLTRRGDFYYLFVNWGRCCRGTNSTYEVRVGRSPGVGGPFLDREGTDLVKGGGTLFLASAGRYIGPGHIGVFKEGAWFSYHYYDAETKGRSRLALAPLDWSADGWPTPGTTHLNSRPTSP